MPAHFFFSAALVPEVFINFLSVFRVINNLVDHSRLKLLQNQFPYEENEWKFYYLNMPVALYSFAQFISYVLVCISAKFVQMCALTWLALRLKGYKTHILI